MLKHGVCVILPIPELGPDGILAISRRNDTTQWGLPGGKVDPGETNLQAILRETKEECNLDLNPVALIPIFNRICYGKDDVDYWVTTYLYTEDWNRDNLKPEIDFTLLFISLVQLGSEHMSPFYTYNQDALVSWRSYRDHNLD